MEERANRKRKEEENDDDDKKGSFSLPFTLYLLPLSSILYNYIVNKKKVIFNVELG